jgi:hypothetical protein
MRPLLNGGTLGGRQNWFPPVALICVALTHMPSLTDLARTNYILAALREPLSAGQDVYVKWSAMRAFNGACLRRDPGGTEVYFLAGRSKQTWEDFDVVCELPELVVVVRPFEWTPAVGLRQLIANADTRFVGNTESFSLVSRLVLSLNTSDVSATVAVVRDLASDLGARPPSLELFGTPGESGSVDAELILAEPAHEQAVRDRLAIDFPGLPDDSIFGAGIIWLDGGADAHASSNVTWAGIFARQY